MTETMPTTNPVFTPADMPWEDEETAAAVAVDEAVTVERGRESLREDET